MLFALILLSESLHALEIAGGVLIFAGIAFERIAAAAAEVPLRDSERSVAGVRW